MECLYDILFNANQVTDKLINLLENENIVIKKHNKTEFENIIKEKNALIKQYSSATKITKEHLNELQEIYPEDVEKFLDKTKTLNQMCKSNYEIINREFEVTDKIIKLVKKTIKESKDHLSIVSAKI